MILEKSDFDTINKVKRLKIAGYGALSLGTVGFGIFDWNGYLEHPLNPDLALVSWAVFLLGLIAVVISKALEKSNFNTMAKVKIGVVSVCAILWFAFLIVGGHIKHLGLNDVPVLVYDTSGKRLEMRCLPNHTDCFAVPLGGSADVPLSPDIRYLPVTPLYAKRG